MDKFFNENDLYYRYLNLEDIKIFKDLTNEVYRGLEDKAIYILDSEEEYTAYLEGNDSRALGVFNEKGELICSRQVNINPKEYSLTKKVQVVDIPEEGTVRHRGTIVRKDYRGRGLQNRTRQIIEENLLKEGYSRFMAIVSPYNKYSLANTLMSNFDIVTLIENYTKVEDKNVDRFVFFKDINNPLQYTTNIKQCDVHNNEEINKLINSGYVGAEINENILTFKEVKR